MNRFWVRRKAREFTFGVGLASAAIGAFTSDITMFAWGVGFAVIASFDERNDILRT